MKSNERPDQSNYVNLSVEVAREGGVRIVLPGGRAVRMTTSRSQHRLPVAEPNAFVTHEVIDSERVVVWPERAVEVE